eukprot:579037-Rhodomonas_salina.1
MFVGDVCLWCLSPSLTVVLAVCISHLPAISASGPSADTWHLIANTLRVCCPLLICPYSVRCLPVGAQPREVSAGVGRRSPRMAACGTVSEG